MTIVGLTTSLNDLSIGTTLYCIASLSSSSYSPGFSISQPVSLSLLIRVPATTRISEIFPLISSCSSISSSTLSPKPKRYSSAISKTVLFSIEYIGILLHLSQIKASISAYFLLLVPVRGLNRFSSISSKIFILNLYQIKILFHRYTSILVGIFYICIYHIPYYFYSMRSRIKK